MNVSLKNIKSLLVLFALCFIASGTVSAQCGLVVKQGIKKLAPYTHNGQVNNATLVLGEPSQIHLAFYKGLNYKLQFCSDPAVGVINFRVLDENNQEVFSGSSNNESSWEFFSNSSQELVVEITSADKNKSGCAAVVVGIQAPKTNAIRNL